MGRRVIEARLRQGFVTLLVVRTVRSFLCYVLEKRKLKLCRLYSFILGSFFSKRSSRGLCHCQPSNYMKNEQRLSVTSVTLKVTAAVNSTNQWHNADR